MNDDDADVPALLPVMQLAKAIVVVLAFNLALMLGSVLAAAIGTSEDPLEVLTLQSYGLLIILVLLWVYRAYANLRSLGVPTQGGPLSCVVVWFIPFVNLVLPYRRCSEILWGSVYVDPDSSVDTESPIMSWEPPALLFWWLAWISFNVFGGELEKVGLGLAIVAGVLLAVFVWRASARQHEAIEAIGVQSLSDPIWGKVALGWWAGGALLGWAAASVGLGSEAQLIAFVLVHTIVGLTLAILGVVRSRAPRGAFTIVAITSYCVMVLLVLMAGAFGALSALFMTR